MTNYNVTMGVAKAALEKRPFGTWERTRPCEGSREFHLRRPREDNVRPRRERFQQDAGTWSPRGPMRRNCEPAEVADTAVFLASDLARGVTGNCLLSTPGTS